MLLRHQSGFWAFRDQSGRKTSAFRSHLKLLITLQSQSFRSSVYFWMLHWDVDAHMPACVDMNSRCWQSHRSASLTVTFSPASSQTSIKSLIQDRNTAKPSVRTNPDSGLSSHLPTAPQPALPDEETQKECSFKIIARSTCTLVSLSWSWASSLLRPVRRAVVGSLKVLSRRCCTF